MLMRETKTRVLALLSNIKTWMWEQKLKLNENKTKIMLIKGDLRPSITQRVWQFETKYYSKSLATWMLKPLHLLLLTGHEI